MKGNGGAATWGRRARPARGLFFGAALAGAAGCLGVAAPAGAQLPGSSAALRGMGGTSAALARGFAAVAGNPAGLAMPRASPLTATFLPVHVVGALGPVTLRDLAEFDGRPIPHDVREAWIGLIERRGAQRGRLDADLTAAGVSHGTVGFQLSTVAAAAADLNPDAAELLLFGNAGRTGEPRDFQLAGSSLDGWAVTTAALAVGLPLDVEIGDAPGQSFAVGGTLKVTLGHALYLGRDLGTFFAGDPLEVLLRFPVIHTEGGAGRMGGGGVSFDLGFQWEAPAWGFGLVARNLVSTFRWNEERLVFRPGTALFGPDDPEVDFRPRPAHEAPETLLADVRAFRFGPRLSAGLAHQPAPRVSVATELAAALGRSATADARLEAALGVEVRPREWLPVRAHVSVAEQGVRFGGGASLVAGSLHLSGAVSLLRAAREDASAVAVTLSLGGS